MIDQSQLTDHERQLLMAQDLEYVKGSVNRLDAKISGLEQAITTTIRQEVEKLNSRCPSPLCEEHTELLEGYGKRLGEVEDCQLIIKTKLTVLYVIGGIVLTVGVPLMVWALDHWF